ncbi:MAG: DUF3990 domain-containing protein [Elusimicrobiota bacterium]|jgi:hypothetical protein|nr:DUF3990 domain-containing protein [Elusimicrobiota bacterium]
MILYHGSYKIIERPDISFSRSNVDFGKGFYTTTILAQAKNWCKRFKEENKQAFVSRYKLAGGALKQIRKIKEFKEYSQEWLDFIMACRRGADTKKYDLVIGGVANDKVFNTIELFFDGLIDKNAALGKLKYEKPNIQYCFKTQKIMNDFLTFAGCEEI